MNVHDELQEVKKELAKIHSREKAREWRLNNLERAKETQAAWNKKNRNQYQKKYREKNGYS